MTPNLYFSPQNQEKTIYTRRLHGAERMFASVGQCIDGYGHMFIGAHVSFKAAISKEKLLSASKAAWMRTRFMAPWVAVRTTRLESSKDAEPNAWQHVYEAPRTYCDQTLIQWAENTVIWREELFSSADWEAIIKSECWRPDDARYAVEYHISSALEGGGFYFMASMGHWLTDARGFLYCKEVFFNNLREVLEGSATPLDCLPWGDEVSRLPPAVVEIIQTTPDVMKVMDDLKKNIDITKDTSRTQKQFIRPILETDDERPLQYRQTDIKLSASETSAFHTACKNHGVKATAVLNSIAILADIETALRGVQDEESFKCLVESFRHSDVYFIGGNVVDRRYILDWSSVWASDRSSFGNVVCETFVTKHSMNFIRQCIKIAENRAVSVTLANSTFWDGIVGEAASQLSINSQSTPDVIYATQDALDQAASYFNAFQFTSSGIISSSIGRFSSMGLFNSFTPQRVSENLKNTLVVEDIWIGLHTPVEGAAPLVMMTWEYNDKLTIHLLGSPKWHSNKAWNLLVESYERSLEYILQCAII